MILFAATGGGAGYLPLAKGTAGSVVGLGLYAAAAPLPTGLFLLLATGVAASAVWIAGRAEQLLGRKDDSRIVIDEVAGMLVSLALLPARIDVAVVAFVLFRLFDIWKPPPARRAERLGGGVGVVMDDVVAGLYANLAGQLLWRVALPEGLL
ncbi:MAG: phosphatidylglycerophosphatase A [Myxococcota bacterium]